MTDCVLFRVVNVFGNGCEEEYAMPKFERMTGEEAFEASLTWKIHGVYMVRAAIHREYLYDETCRGYSDDNATRLHYMASREVRTCDGIYYYRQHAESTTHKIGLIHFDYLKANASMKLTLEQMNVGDRIIGIYEKVRWLNLIDEYMFFFIHRSRFSHDERRKALSMMRSAWMSINTSLIEKKLRRKYGYMPIRCSWMLFRIQEETYFLLRKAMGRLHIQY